MRRDTEIGIIAGIVLVIIVGVFISTKTVVKEPTIPLSHIYKEKSAKTEEQDLGVLTQQSLPEIIELPEERPEATVPIPKLQPPARAITQEEEYEEEEVIEDEWVEKDEAVEGEWEEIELPPITVLEETKHDTKTGSAEVKEPEVAIYAEEDIVYKVKPNDTLTKLARQYYGDESKWGLIYNANIGKIPNRNALYVGQEIVIPGISSTPEKQTVVELISSPPVQLPVAPEEAGKRTHTVQKGDTLIKLARQYYNSEAAWKKIYSANMNVIPNPNNISQGTVLIIPE